MYNNRGSLAGQLAPLGSLLEKLCKLELENDPGPGGVRLLLGLRLSYVGWSCASCVSWSWRTTLAQVG